VRRIALVLIVTGVFCFGVTAVDIIAIIVGHFRGVALPFEAFFAKAVELRVWSIAGVVLFLVGCLFLWFTPDQTDEKSI
jgi:hypothetical protein